MLSTDNVVVVGLARSGIAAASFLARRGAGVVAVDRKGEDELPPEALALREAGVRLELGPHRRETFEGATLVVVSPGVPWELAELEAARRAGVPVIAEIELAFRHLRGRVAAITGTKGKSTTTAALGAMLREAGFDARVGGNIGAPLVGLVEGSTDATVFAVEVSSFQLEGAFRFRAHVAVWLNLSPDHLDRHPTLESYVAAKARVFANQDALTDPDLVGYADSLGLDAAAFERALAEGTHQARMQWDMTEGMARGVTGTPTYFLNGFPLQGVPRIWVLELALDAFRRGLVKPADTGRP